MILEEGGTILTFTHRRANQNVSWGLEFECTSGESTEGFVVRSVLPGGAMESWNRICFGGSVGKEIIPGDRIMSTNGKVSCAEMFQEFKSQSIIKFVVTRESFGI